jgi:mRNA interferase RelE/StbE
MVFYTITWRKSTKKDLRKIPEGDVLEILQAVETLAGNPFPIGSTKLIGTLDVHRIRVGIYRDGMKSCSNQRWASRND